MFVVVVAIEVVVVVLVVFADKTDVFVVIWVLQWRELQGIDKTVSVRICRVFART
jgi:hypothetical protein